MRAHAHTQGQNDNVHHVLHRFSGVTEEDLENASITLRDVQAVMLNMFSAESILIGHSLESDLFALKVNIHTPLI